MKHTITRLAALVLAPLTTAIVHAEMTFKRQSAASFPFCRKILLAALRVGRGGATVGLLAFAVILLLEVGGVRRQVILSEVMDLVFNWPDDIQRAASFEAVATVKIGKESVRDYLLQRTYILAAAPKDSTVGLESWDSIEPRITELGSAAAITRDGYMLTAEHCIVGGNRDLFVVFSGGPGEPKVVAWRARVVWANRPADLALVHVKELPKRHFQLGSPDSVKAGDGLASAGAYYSCERSGSGNVTLDCAAGKCIEVKGGGDNPFVTRLISNLPSHPGDSGGPTISLDGVLVGINSSANGRLPQLLARLIPMQITGTVSKGIDSEYVNRIVDEDRQRLTTISK